MVDEEGNVVVPANTVLNRIDVEAIDKAGIKEVKARSALTCDLDYGICQKCYGYANK
ncbi:MAG: hypothetical protein MZU97_02250 [Bacillus subtilis]|nr:hypothetical protein [Bacillus subtilis]